MEWTGQVKRHFHSTSLWNMGSVLLQSRTVGLESSSSCSSRFLLSPAWDEESGLYFPPKTPEESRSQAEAGDPACVSVQSVQPCFLPAVSSYGLGGSLPCGDAETAEDRGWGVDGEPQRRFRKVPQASVPRKMLLRVELPSLHRVLAQLWIPLCSSTEVDSVPHVL